MKLTLSAVGLLSLAVTAAHADQLFYEPFNYASGQLLTTANSNVLLNGSGDDTAVVPGNLSISGLAVSLGNSITNGGAGAAVRLPIGSTINGGSLYYSFAMRIDTVGASFTSTTGFIASFINQAANDQQGRLAVKSAVGGYQIGATKLTSTAAVFDPTVYTEVQTLFIVGKYTFNSGGGTDDAFSLWINPSTSSFGSGSDPAATLVATLTGSDAAQFDYFAFRQNTAANTPSAINYDELRIGTTWADVTTPVPEPSAMAFAAVGALAFTAARRAHRRH